MPGDQTLGTVSRLQDVCQVPGVDGRTLSDSSGSCDGWREEVETRDVRDALTGGC